MARPSKPWFRASKNTWYVTVDGQKVSLKVRGEDNEKEALTAWHRLMAGVEPTPPTKPTPPPTQEPEPEEKPAALTVADVVRGFLADCDTRVRGEGEAPLKAATVRGYRDFLTPFSEKHGEARADSITAKIASNDANKPSWSNSTRNGFLSALSIAFRWAGHPIANLRKPPMQSRGKKALISEADHARLMEHAAPYFKPFLSVLHLIGCRPGEAAKITAENFDEERAVIILEEHKTDKTGRDRILFLTPEAVAILRQQKAKHGTGHLFRGRYGKPYSKNAIVHHMTSLRKKAGVKGATAYGVRHSFATDALAAGVPDATVAALMGHSGTTMLHKHYSHLTSKANVLRAALGQVRGKGEA